MDVIDHVVCQDLSKLIEELATAGKPVLEEETIKKIKKICRTSNGYVEYAYHQLDTWLEKDHSEIRLSTLLMYDQLFQRSHHFRTLLLVDFQNFIELTLETNPTFPLPAPKPAAEKLKTQAIEIVHKWQQKFGQDYKQLALGYNYLKTCKKIDFENQSSLNEAQRRRNEERQQRIQMIQQERVNGIIREMTEMNYEVENLLSQADTCLRLILPDPEGFDAMSPRNEERFGMFSPARMMMSPRRNSKSPRRSGKRRSTTSESAANCDSKDDIKKELDEGEQSESSQKQTLKYGPVPDGSDDVKTEGGTSLTNNQDTDMNAIKTEIESEQKYSETSDKANEKSEQSSEHSQSTVKVKQETPESSSETTKNGKTDAKTDENSDEEFYEISSSEEDEEEEEEEYDDEDLEEAYYSQQAQFVREHGLGTQVYNLNIEIAPNDVTVEENEDNRDLLLSLTDILRLINVKLLPTVNNWLEVFTKNGGSQDNIKSAIDTRDALQKTREKIEKLNIKVDVKQEEDDEDDDDFEDVPDASQKEGYEPHIPKHLRAEYGLEDEPQPKQPVPSTSRDWTPYKPEVENPKDPTSSASTLKKLGIQLGESASAHSSPKPKTVIKKQTINVEEPAIPVIPFGADLKHWGQKDVEPPLLVRYDSEHRFWTPKENEEVIDVNALEARSSRIINFTGKFVPVKWKCRAPLPNGKLCERMDRVKCPFHGKVVGRDNMGRPTNPEDAERLAREEEKRQRENPAWEDPELHAEIEAATGKDLKRKAKGKGKQKKYPHLTDLKKKKNTSRNRLEAKVMSRQAIKRVCSAMNSLESKRFRDKFGNNFNYAYKQT